jgi:hypothetical protein
VTLNRLVLNKIQELVLNLIQEVQSDGTTT